MAEQTIRDSNGTAQTAQLGSKADVASGTLATNASSVTSASIIGYVGAFIYITGGNISGASIAFSLSLDGGSTFPVPVVAERLDYPAAHDSTFTVLSGNPCGFSFWVPLPPSASTSTGVQLKVASTAGTFTSAPTVTIVPSVSTPVSRSNSRIATSPAFTSANGLVLVDFISGTTAASATSGLTGWFDAGAYVGKAANITIGTLASTNGAVLTAEYCNDPSVETGATYKGWLLTDPSLVTGVAPAPTITLAALSVFSRIGTVPARFIRLRCSTAISAGGATVVVSFSDAAPVPQMLQVMGQGAAGQTIVYPMVTGGIARTTQPATSTDNRGMPLLLDRKGSTVVTLGHIRELQNTLKSVTISTTTETSLIAAVASTFFDIFGFTITNTSATGVRVDFRDTLAGTVVESVWVPPTTTFRLSYDLPLKQSAINTAWTAQLSAAVTDVRISASYITTT